jgi:hypothetical protein
VKSVSDISSISDKKTSEVLERIQRFYKFIENRSSYVVPLNEKPKFYGL